MNEPEIIATAPQDGTVILTDQGFALYHAPQPGDWGFRGKIGWYPCSPGGHINVDSDEGMDEPVDPKLWVPVPKWICQ